MDALANERFYTEFRSFLLQILLYSKQCRLDTTMFSQPRMASYHGFQFQLIFGSWYPKYFINFSEPIDFLRFYRSFVHVVA